MVEESAGKCNVSNCCYIFSNLCCRSLRNFDDWNEIIDFRSEFTRDVKTLTKNQYKTSPTFRMSVMQKRKINLSVINSWLQNRHDLDQLVIESLSKCSLIPHLPLFMIHQADNDRLP